MVCAAMCLRISQPYSTVGILAAELSDILRRDELDMRTWTTVMVRRERDEECMCTCGIVKRACLPAMAPALLPPLALGVGGGVGGVTRAVGVGAGAGAGFSAVH